MSLSVFPITSVLLEARSASSSASLDFTSWKSLGDSGITPSTDQYIIEIIGIVPGTNGAALTMRCSTDGGSTYDAASNYAWARFGWSNAGNGTAGSQSDT